MPAAVECGRQTCDVHLNLPGSEAHTSGDFGKAAAFFASLDMGYQPEAGMGACRGEFAFCCDGHHM